MKTNNNTILITGGSAGIGFEIAKLFSSKGNHVIITGRDKNRLERAAAKLSDATAIQCDISNAADVEKLVQQLNTDFPKLNIVINNAGRASVYKLSDTGANAYEKGADEMLTNYLSVVRLNEQLLPALKKQPEAAIVNVSSIVAFVPGAMLPTYAASKAALHSYTQSLRVALSKSPVKVFELMPPLVDTELSKEIGGANGISPTVVASELFSALEKNEYEIHVGNTAHLYKAFLSSPAEALKMMNNE
ncbi:MAG: family NAD(P)-dependent oxidoreductase [Bacteroidetes bacterium]|jgi:uncharacterized oxidoreductase|nr:family NAD(P)-dependent oxidoreductase [Bacteroidota bacterium]